MIINNIKKNHRLGALCLIGIKDMQSNVEVYINIINNKDKSNILNGGINFLIIGFIIFLYILLNIILK